MSTKELGHVVIAIILFAIVGSFGYLIKGNVGVIPQIILFAVIIIGASVLVKKAIAYSLDANVEHRIWGVYQYWYKPQDHFKREVPAGAIIPLFVALISVGIVKITTFLTYETRALKYRAAKRFGYYSYSEMTDWHNGLIGASGIVVVLLISFVGYLLGYEYLTKMAAYYAFWNMIPVSNLDGTQILFGSKVIWTALAVITCIFTAYALLLGI